MNVYRDKETGEIRIPTPEGDWDKALAQDSRYERGDTNTLRDWIGEEAFATLPRSIRDDAAPPEHKDVPRVKS